MVALSDEHGSADECCVALSDGEAEKSVLFHDFLGIVVGAVVRDGSGAVSVDAMRSRHSFGRRNLSVRKGDEAGVRPMAAVGSVALWRMKGKWFCLAHRVLRSRFWGSMTRGVWEHPR